MTLFFRHLLSYLLVLLLLVTGCGAINHLMEEELTGPSWDVDLVLPLLPMQRVEVGRELARYIDLDVEGPIYYQDSQELFKQYLTDLVQLNQTSFDEVISLDREYEEVYHTIMDSIEDSIGQLRIEKEFSIDDLGEDTLSLQDLSYSRTFSTEEEEFPSIDEKLHKILDSFSEYRKEWELPSMDKGLESMIMSNIREQLSFGPEDLLVSTQEEDSIELAIPFDFHVFKRIYLSSGSLEIGLENRTGTTFTSMDILLYDRKREKVLSQGSIESIESGSMGILEMCLEGVPIGQSMEMKILLNVAEPIEMEWVNLYMDLLPGWSLEKVQVLEENSYHLTLEESLENLSSTIKEALFNEGTLELELTLPQEYGEDYLLRVSLGEVLLREGKNELTQEKMLFYDPSGYIGEVLLVIEEMDTYVIDAKAHFSLSLSEPQVERVRMVEPFTLDLPEIDVDLSGSIQLEEVTFLQGDFIIELESTPQEWEEDLEYTLQVKIGEEVFQEGVHSLEGKTLSPHKMGVLFSGSTHSYYKGASLEVRTDLVDLVIHEAILKTPLKLQEIVQIEFTDFPEELQEMTIEEGYLEIQIDDGGLGLEYSLEMTIDGQRLERVQGSSDLYSLEGLTLSGDSEGLVVAFEASMNKYRKDATVQIGVKLHEEKDLRVGRIELARPLVETLSFQLSEIDDIFSSVEYLTFSEGLLGISIEDRGLDLDYSLECWFGEERLSPINEGASIFHLEDRTLFFREKEGLTLQLTLYGLTPDPEGSLSARVLVEDFGWREIGVYEEEMDLLEYTLFHEGEEEIYPLYLDELPSFIKQLYLNPNLSSLKILFDNKTSIGLFWSDPLRIEALDSHGGPLYDEKGDLLEVLIDYSIEPYEKKKVDLLALFFPLLEAYPHSLRLSGGTLNLGSSPEKREDGENVVILKPEMWCSIEAHFHLVASFKLLEDPLNKDPLVIYLPLNPVDIEIEGQEELGSWIKEATLHYRLINHMPLNGSLYLSLGEFYGDLNHEEDVQAFYSQEDLLYFELLGLPKAIKDEDGFAIGESPLYEGEIAFRADDLDWLAKENLHVGFTVEIPLESDEYISFSTSDYLKLSAWVHSMININPKENQ